MRMSMSMSTHINVNYLIGLGRPSFYLDVERYGG